MNRQVDGFIDALPNEAREAANSLRKLIFQLVPEVEERFSFTTPFYHYFGMFCYISKVKQGIELCFCRGKDLVLQYPELEMRNRTMAAGVTITTSKEIGQKNVRMLLSAAAAWQKQAWMEKKGFVAAKSKKAQAPTSSSKQTKATTIKRGVENK